jgi:hypothetical protein
MGQPEGEEDRVVAAWRLPGEHIRLDELDRQVLGALAGQGQHLGGRVNGGHRAGAGGQQPGPVAAAAGQLQHVPGSRQLLDAPVPVLAEVDVVVVRCPGAVVGNLLGHERLHIVVHGLSLPSRKSWQAIPSTNDAMSGTRTEQDADA